MFNGGQTPWFLGNSTGIADHWWGGGLAFLAVWSILWTGLALWHAARRQEKGWFIVFLVIHTAGILELIYLVFVAKVFASPKSSKKRSSR